MKLDEGELRRPVDGDEQVELAFSRPDLGDVDVKVADGIGFEPRLGRLIALDLRQAADPVALEATVKR